MSPSIYNWLGNRPPIEPPPPGERESFIALHVLDLVRLLCPKVAEGGQDPEQFRLFCMLVLSLLHEQYRQRHQHLTHLYLTLDPDVDSTDTFLFPSVKEGTVSEETIREGREKTSQLARESNQPTAILFDKMGEILERANYRRLSPLQIQSAVSSASRWGVKLRVRFSMFKRLEVYSRGEVDGTRLHRRWKSFWKLEKCKVPIYRRLIVLFRVKEGRTFDESIDPTKAHLRMFKNIPKYDVDMLLPGTGIRISLLDHGKIGIPSLWGVSMLIWKIVRNAWLLAFIGIAKAFTSVALVIAVGIALLFFLVRSFFSYTSTKRRYMLDVTRNLYYQNLDNNMGALLRLLDEAEQQEACESILAYFILSGPEATEPMSMEILDLKCEALLEELTGMNVDFDVDDAVRDLAPLGIISHCGNGWTALPLERALAKLNEIWDSSFFPNMSLEKRSLSR